DTSTVGSHYDPLLAKIIAHGHDRDQARRRLVAALEDTVAQGVVTNRGFLLAVLDHASFEAGPVSTRWLGEAAVMGARPSSDEVAAVARWLHMARERDADQRSPGLAGWSSRGWTRSRQRLRLDGDTWDIEVQRTAEGVAVTAVPATGSTSADNAHPRRDDRAAASDDGRASRSERATDGERATAGDSPRPTGDEPDVTALRPRPDRVLAHLPRLDIDATDVLQAPPAPRHAGGGGIVTAPMHGVIAAVAVAVGDTVARGDDLVTLEAMKMEHRLRAPIAGVVTHVVAATTQAAMDDVVVRLEAPTSSHASDKDTATRESGSP
ncbi:MAG TPA: biotin/lipoyl-containing protein, partial [Nitriliruptoraceae bacterium]|nr:biotin/lipoyl-containing protein [Nitriliruptoraceae bacterium]